MGRKVLFVCSGNLDRSPTAEEMLKDVKGLEVKSAGTLMGAPTVISRELIEWADVIFAMEKSHKGAVMGINPGAEKKVVVLNIVDRYRRNDPELIRILKEKLSEYLKEILRLG